MVLNQQRRFALFMGVLLLTQVFTACHPKDKAPTPKKKYAPGDSLFYEMADRFIDGYLNWRPQQAVALGFHQYDGKLTDYSKASIQSERAKLLAADKQLLAIDSTTLSPRAYYRLKILHHGILTELFNMEDFDIYATNPMAYANALDVNIYIKRDFAPFPERVKSIIAMENNLPSVFEAARQNLKDSLALPYVQMAIDIVSGVTDFLKGDLVTAMHDLKNDTLKQQFKVSNAKAIASLVAYRDFLKKDKLPKAHLHYAIGREKYKRMLYAVDGLTEYPEQILAHGMSELAEEQRRFTAAAAAINPKKLPVEVYHDMQKEHATADQLIPLAKKNLENIRQFLIDKKLLTIPSDVRVQVLASPQYLRSVSSASMDTPGPFETKATEAYYYITPVENNWTPQQKEDWLSQFDFYTTDNTSIHEAYPGHYMQFLHLNASSADKIEKIFGCYTFIEGWAHYTEKMMIDEGFGQGADRLKGNKYKLAQSGDALLRLCRLCVAIKTHCEGMSVDEATKFFMDNWFQGEKPSKQEALRGTFDPQYLFYTVGKMELLSLRAEYKAKQGANYSLQKFHDAVLDNGMPPIYLLRELLLNEKL